MKKIIALLVFLIPSVVLAGGLEAAFSGSRLPNARSSMIFQYRGDTIDGAGNLIDVSGENILSYSEAFDSWTPTRATVTVDAYKNPLDWAKNADVIREDNSAASSHYVTTSFTQVVGNTQTYAVYVRSSNRNWVQLQTWRESASAYYNLTTGVVGTTANVIDSGIQNVIGNPGWYRCWFKFIATTNVSNVVYIIIAESDTDTTFDGLTQDSLIVYGAQVVDNTDGYIQGPGVYHATTVTTKPRLDLAPTSAPPGIDSHLQDSGGNKLRARSFDGATQYYSRAHHDAMNVFDQDHTITFVMLGTSAGSGVENSFLSHGNYMTHGIFCEEAFNSVVQCHYSKAGAAVNARVSTAISDSMFHVIQVVRNSNRAILYYDGVPGLSTDVTGYGIDVNSTLYFGAYWGGTAIFNGSILYASLDNRALNHAELTSDLEQIRGVFGHRLLGSDTPWLFTRTTTAKQSFSTGGIRNVPINVPRVSNGILFEGQRTNIITYSEQINQNPPWIPVRMSVTNTSSTNLPDSAASGFHVLHEDATPATTHALSTQSYATTIGNKYTTALYVKPINRHWILLNNSAGPAAYVSYDVSSCIYRTISNATATTEPIGDGWCRITMTHTATAVNNQLLVYIMDADYSVTFATFNGLDQDSLFIWGRQTEESAFATSYCGPTTTGSLTCTADNMTLELDTPTGALLIVGDSISRDIAYYIGSVYGIDNYINSGVGGNSLDDVRNRWVIDVLAYNPSTIYMHAGLGDILFYPYTLADMQADVSWIATECESRGIKLIVDNVGTAVAYTAPQEAQAVAYNAWLATTFAAAHPSVTVLDFMTWAQNGSGDPKVCNPAWFDAACVHPNAVGNPLWSALVYAGFPNILLRESLALPKVFLPSGPTSKLTFELEAKCEFSSSTNIGGFRTLFKIDGIGTQSVSLYINDTGHIISEYVDAGSTGHYVYSGANPVNFSDWFKLKGFFDFADLSRLNMWINGSTAGLAYVANVGSSTFTRTGSLLYMGYDDAMTRPLFCKIRGLRIEPKEF